MRSQNTRRRLTAATNMIKRWNSTASNIIKHETSAIFARDKTAPSIIKHLGLIPVVVIELERVGLNVFGLIEGLWGLKNKRKALESLRFRSA
jgi:hypothetical protein